MIPEPEALTRMRQRTAPDDALVVEYVDALLAVERVMVRFVMHAVQDHCQGRWWNDADLQDHLQEAGILEPILVDAAMRDRCGDACNCEVGDVCLRLSAIGSAVCQAAL